MSASSDTAACLLLKLRKTVMGKFASKGVYRCASARMGLGGCLACCLYLRCGSMLTPT
jgi:hypothetical protein